MSGEEWAAFSVGITILGWVVIRLESIAKLLNGHLRDHSKGTPLSTFREARR